MRAKNGALSNAAFARLLFVRAFRPVRRSRRRSRRERARRVENGGDARSRRGCTVAARRRDATRLERVDRARRLVLVQRRRRGRRRRRRRRKGFVRRKRWRRRGFVRRRRGRRGFARRRRRPRGRRGPRRPRRPRRGVDRRRRRGRSGLAATLFDELLDARVAFFLFLVVAAVVVPAPVSPPAEEGPASRPAPSAVPAVLARAALARDAQVLRGAPLVGVGGDRPVLAARARDHLPRDDDDGPVVAASSVAAAALVPRGGGFRERAGGERAERGEKRREAREPPHGRRASVGQRASRAPGRGLTSRNRLSRRRPPREKRSDVFRIARARRGTIASGECCIRQLSRTRTSPRSSALVRARFRRVVALRPRSSHARTTSLLLTRMGSPPAV